MTFADNLENQFHEFVVVEASGGITELNVDGSVTEVKASLEPEQEFGLKLQTVVFTFANEAIDVGTFVGLPALENGLLIQLRNQDDDVLHDFLDGRAIQEHRHFQWLVGERRDFEDKPGNLVDELTFRWDLGDAGSVPVLTEGVKFTIVIRDDLTGINAAEILCQGTRKRGW